VSRYGFFERPQWQITGAFFGLLSCRISLDLKAALFNTLSAFTKTSEIAMHFWKIIGDIDVKIKHFLKFISSFAFIVICTNGKF
jgi:hypothetical protein